MSMSQHTTKDGVTPSHGQILYWIHAPNMRFRYNAAHPIVAFDVEGFGNEPLIEMVTTQAKAQAFDRWWRRRGLRRAILQGKREGHV